MLTFRHQFLDLGNRATGIEILRTGLRAVKNRMATIKPERIFKRIEALAGGFVATVDYPAICL